MMKIHKKGAIGLSINTIVVVIISLVVLGGGMSLLFKFIGGADSVKNSLDTRTEAELERLLIDQGKLVALPLHTVTIEVGKPHVFGIGILNIGAPTDQFRVEAKVIKFIDRDNQATEGDALPEGDELMLYNKDAIKVDAGAHEKQTILVEIPDSFPTGQYIFDARVFNEQAEGPKLYGNPQKFYVTVE